MKFFLLLIFLFTPFCYGYVYDPNDFAVEIIDYTPHEGNHKNPLVALGRPEIETAADNSIFNSTMVPVVPPFPAWSSTGQYLNDTQVYAIPIGGYVTLKLGRDVEDNPNHPFGIDFIVFGNVLMWNSGNPPQLWKNGDPASYTVSGTLNDEPGIVSVAFDPQGPWYTYSNGPYADSFAPTMGRMYVDDPNGVDNTLGSWNLWWGEVTDPTIPIDPNLQASDFAGHTIKQICEAYGKSSGGTGFDLSEAAAFDSAFSVIRYVRIETPTYQPDYTYKTTLDAISIVSEGECGDEFHPFPVADITQDCVVNLLDFALFSSFWLQSVNCESLYNLDKVDCEINMLDLTIFGQDWLSQTWY